MNNAVDVAERLIRELEDGTAERDERAWMGEASVTLQRLVPSEPMIMLELRDALTIFNDAKGKTSDKLRAVQKAFAEKNGRKAISEGTRARDARLAAKETRPSYES